MISSRVKVKFLIWFICGVFVIFSSTQCVQSSQGRNGNSSSKSDFSKGADCVRDFSQISDRYLSKSMNQVEIKKFWTCVKDRVQQFQSYAKGRETGQYSRSEIRVFLNYYFDIRPSEDAWSSILALKSVFLSRQWTKESLQRVTESELIQFIDLFNLFEEITIDLNPHLDVLLGYPKKSGLIASASRREGAILAMKKSLKSLGRWMDKNAHFPDIPQLKVLVQGVKVGGKSQIDLSAWVDVLDRGRNILVDESSRQEPRTQTWTSLFRMSGRLLEIYSYNDLLGTSSDLTRGEGLAQLTKVVQGAQKVFSDALLARGEQGLPSSEVHAFIESIYSADFLSKDRVDIATLKATWDLLVDKLLRSKESSQVGVLHTSHLTTFKVEFQDWLDTQVWVENGGEINKNLSCDDPLIRGGSEILQIATCSPWPLRKDSQARSILSKTLLGESWTREDLSSLNWKRGLIRQIIRVYSGTPNDIVSGLTLEELEVAYVDLAPLLRAIGLISGDDKNLYKKVFLYSNLLTPMADGNQKISQGEAIGYLEYLLSSMKVVDLFSPSLKHCGVESALGYRSRHPLWIVFILTVIGIAFVKESLSCTALCQI